MDKRSNSRKQINPKRLIKRIKRNAIVSKLQTMPMLHLFEKRFVDEANIIARFAGRLNITPHDIILAARMIIV